MTYIYLHQGPSMARNEDGSTGGMHDELARLREENEAARAALNWKATENERLRAVLRQIELNARTGGPLIEKLGWLARQAITSAHEQIAQPVTTEQLDKLQFGRVLHERHSEQKAPAIRKCVHGVSMKETCPKCTRRSTTDRILARDAAPPEKTFDNPGDMMKWLDQK
jgi:hypothetical protein